MMTVMAANAKKVLVAYDGSKSAQRALDVAADLIGYGSTLAVVSVHSNGSTQGTTIVNRAREHLLGRQITALFLEPSGEPAEKIVEAAEALEADLVVIGRRRGDLRRAVGSVSAEVVQEAPCDVLVVR